MKTTLWDQFHFLVLFHTAGPVKDMSCRKHDSLVSRVLLIDSEVLLIPMVEIIVPEIEVLDVEVQV